MSAATNKTVIAVVLAAGSATRFGATKQLAEIDGTALVNRAVRTAAASRAATTAVVVGHDWQAVSKAISPFDGFLVLNDDHAAGIGSSLALAARAVRHAADALVVLLADQPLITAAHVDALIAAWSDSDADIVATSFSSTSGPPALFAAACFDELAQLEGDSGARELLANPRYEQERVAFAAAAIDVDVPDDLNRL